MNAKPTTNHLNGTVATIPAELSQQTPSSSEVVPKAKRRTFSADYKRRILKEAVVNDVREHQLTIDC